MARHTNRARQPRVAHAGVTLVELLVVVAIAVILLGVAVPMVKPALESGRVREGARQLTVYLNAARTQAVATGRAAGIRIERLSDTVPLSNTAYDVFLVETPEPYSGDIVGATVSLERQTQNNQPVYRLVLDGDSASLTTQLKTALVNNGEVFHIRFGYKGRFYAAERNSTGVYYLQRATLSSDPYSGWTQILPAMFWQTGPDGVWGDDQNNGGPATQAGLGDDESLSLPYQVYLPPKSSATRPLQMPAGTGIDLQYSGHGFVGRQFAATSTSSDQSPVTLVFSPSGSVEYVESFGTRARPTGMIHFLVGKSDQIGVDAEANPNQISGHTFSQNVIDASSVWVSINPRNGTITSAENAWELQSDLDDSIRRAREFAQSVQSMGGT